MTGTIRQNGAIKYMLFPMQTRNVSKVHGCPRLAPLVNNWLISNLAQILFYHMTSLLFSG